MYPREVAFYRDLGAASAAVGRLLPRRRRREHPRLRPRARGHGRRDHGRPAGRLSRRAGGAGGDRAGRPPRPPLGRGGARPRPLARALRRAGPARADRGRRPGVLARDPGPVRRRAGPGGRCRWATGWPTRSPASPTGSPADPSPSATATCASTTCSSPRQRRRAAVRLAADRAVPGHARRGVLPDPEHDARRPQRSRADLVARYLGRLASQGVRGYDEDDGVGGLPHRHALGVRVRHRRPRRPRPGRRPQRRAAPRPCCLDLCWRWPTSGVPCLSDSSPDAGEQVITRME